MTYIRPPDELFKLLARMSEATCGSGGEFGPDVDSLIRERCRETEPRFHFAQFGLLANESGQEIAHDQQGEASARAQAASGSIVIRAVA
jgi:hypothetical protein